MSKKNAKEQGGNPTQGGQNIKRNLLSSTVIQSIKVFDSNLVSVILPPETIVRLSCFLRFPPDGYGNNLRLEQLRGMYAAFLNQARWA